MAKKKPARVQLDPWDMPDLADMAADVLDLGAADADSTIDPEAAAAEPTWADLEAEMARMPHLSDDRKLELRGLARKFEDCRRIDIAANLLGRLPAAGEAHHMIACGKFALWDLVPAAIRQAGGELRDLHIATLGLSKSNVAELCNYLDDGRIGRVSLLCSHYFKGTSKPIFQYAAEELSHRQAARFLCLRSHAKLLLMDFGDRQLVAEASANLRSCSNIEQITLIGSRELYDFHRTWIDELFTANAKE